MEIIHHTRENIIILLPFAKSFLQQHLLLDLNFYIDKAQTGRSPEEASTYLKAQNINCGRV